MPKMHQNTFGGGAPPGPVGRAYAPLRCDPQRPLSRTGGSTSKDREGRAEREGRGLLVRGGEGERAHF